jgi:hypothetical protein
LDDGRHIAPEADQLVNGNDAIAERIEEVEGKALQGAPQRRQLIRAHGKNRSS